MSEGPSSLEGAFFGRLQAMGTLKGIQTLGAALAGNRHTAIIYARPDGGIGFWNAGAETLFGHAPEEALDQRIDLVVPEEYRAMHWAGFERAIGSDGAVRLPGARLRACTRAADVSGLKFS